MNLRSLKIALAGSILCASSVFNIATASLIEFQSYEGNVAMSTDGWGGSSNAGVISASVTSGSTVLAAYLYTGTQGSNGIPTILLDGTSVSLGAEVVNTSYPHTGSHRADVTSIVKSKIESGPGGVYDFDIEETVSGGQVDGSALVVVYENPLLALASIGIFDGFSAIGGDSTSINFADPLDPTDPSFFAEMILGINYSCCNQASTVEVNGSVVSNVAGNNDDGENVANGSLITVGGFDDPYTPSNPTYLQDHERYNLVPNISNGDTSIQVKTNNPSGDDNIFLAGFYVSGKATFNEPAKLPVPEPSTIAIFVLGMIGLASRRFKKQS